MTKQEVMFVHCSLKKKTDKALLITFDNGDEHWLPLSQVIFDTIDGNLGVLEIPRWLALKKGIGS